MRPGGGELSVFRGGRFFLVLQGVLGLLSLLDGGRFSWFLTGVMPLVVWGGSRFLAKVALDVRKAIGEVVAIDWRYKDGCWVEYITVRVKIDIAKSLRVVYLVGVDGHHTHKCDHFEKVKGIANLNFQYGNWLRAQIRQPNVGIGKRVGQNLREDLRGTQNKHKKSKIGNGDAIDESLVRLVRRKLSEGSLFKHSSEDRKSYEWGGCGDFNEIMYDSEKFSERSWLRVSMDNLQDVMDDLALVDNKPDKGWFTWYNNCEGNRVVKERLDIFLVSASWKLGDDMKNLRLSFRFEAYWAKEDEAKDLIKRVRDQCNGDVLTGFDHIRLHLGKCALDCGVTDKELVEAFNQMDPCKAPKEVEIIKDILYYFKSIFGQKINPSMSIVYFSPNSLRDQREQLSGILVFTYLCPFDFSYFQGHP
ncbi:hypothetical protein GOBAR_DD06763 [Gossypium barbadense]|nr:hypothetical protein GOBAR_DD06763 [Gossypium barbadense]